MVEHLRTELPGILAWAVQGCLDWQDVGLGMPEAVRQATANYRSEMDVLAAFLEECCVVHTNAKAMAKDLYGAYARWCDEAGERQATQRAFGMRLTERGFERKRGAGGQHTWLGLGLLSSDPSDPSYPNSGINNTNSPYKANAEKRVTSVTSVTPNGHHPDDDIEEEYQQWKASLDS